MGIRASSNKSGRLEKSDSTISNTSTSSLVDEPFDCYETFTLVWLDANADTDPNQRIQNGLREHISFLVTFNDKDSCEKWLKKHSEDTKVFLVVSGQFGEAIVPRISELQSIIAIYVFCGNEAHHRGWARNYDKVREVTIRKEVLNQCIKQDQIFFDNIEDFKTIDFIKNRSQENASYIAYQLLLEILTSKHYIKTSDFPSELINILRFAYIQDIEGLRLIKEFEDTYSPQRVINLLIGNKPIARFINKALREHNILLLFNLRFFLMTIMDQVFERKARSEIGFRKQFMTLAELENLRANVNQYLIFNGFLTIATERPELTEIPNNNKANIQTVLIEIKAESFPGTVPFVCLEQISGLENNRDILFMCGAIFKIISLKKIKETIWHINLELATDGEIKGLAEQKSKFQKNQDLLSISNIFEQSNAPNQARIYNECLLNAIPTNHPSYAQIKQKANSVGTFSKVESIEPVSLRNTQLILLGLLNRMSPIAKAMFKALQSLTGESILEYNNPSEIPYNKMGDKLIMIFTTNGHSPSTMKTPNSSIKYFILENDESRVDNQERFGSDEDLMFQMSDELYRCYNWEAEEDERADYDDIPKQKREIAKNIHERLKKVYEGFPEPNLNDRPPISTKVIIIWLKGSQRNNNRIDKLRNICKDVVSTFQIFDNAHECWGEILVIERDIPVFLIFDDSYTDLDLNCLINDQHLKKFYRYTPVQPTTNKGPSRDKTLYHFLYDLLEHYSKRGSEFQSRKDPKNAKEMFTKAQRLCKCLTELDK